MVQQYVPQFIINNIEFCIFVLFLTLFLYIRRDKLQIQGNFPLLYMLLYKTTWGIDLMKKWSTRNPKFWKFVAYCSFVLGLVGTVIMIPFMIWQLGFIVDNGIESGGGLVLPIDNGSNEGGFIFYVPFWYWIIVLMFVAVVHEFGHGVISKLFGVKVKSSGFAFAGVIFPVLPAAFVEPDIKDLSTKERWKQIAVLGAGPFANIFFALIFFIMILGIGFISQDYYIDRGIAYDGLDNSSSLHNYDGFESGIISVLQVNDIEINTSDDIYAYFINNLSYEQSINFTIYDENYSNSQVIEVTPYFDGESNSSKIGIFDVTRSLEVKDKFQTQAYIYEELSVWLFWFFLLNFGIGLMNLLPLWITDGGQITRVMLSKYTSEKNTMLGVHLASFLSFILIILTIWPSILF